MNESPQHFAGKARIEKIVLEDGWTIYIRDGQDSFPLHTELGDREYHPDLMAWKDGVGWVIFEIDGKKGHFTESDLQKMKLRDSAFLAFGIRTVRIKTKDLVGMKKQTDELILQDTDYQLAVQVEKYIDTL